LIPQSWGMDKTQRGFAPLHAPFVIPAQAGIQANLLQTTIASIVANDSRGAKSGFAFKPTFGDTMGKE
jgi:hypothetical protein